MLTVAIAVLEDVQGLVVAAVPLPVNCVVNPAHTDSVPAIVGKAFMVTTAVLIQPLLLV